MAEIGTHARRIVDACQNQQQYQSNTNSVFSGWRAISPKAGDFLRSHTMADLGGALRGVGRLHLGAD
jgi:hypothetical protein